MLDSGGLILILLGSNRNRSSHAADNSKHGASRKTKPVVAPVHTVLCAAIAGNSFAAEIAGCLQAIPVSPGEPVWKGRMECFPSRWTEPRGSLPTGKNMHVDVEKIAARSNLGSAVLRIC